MKKPYKLPITENWSMQYLRDLVREIETEMAAKHQKKMDKLNPYQPGFFKRSRCYFFHDYVHRTMPFTDVVTGDKVKYYDCDKCKTRFMATSRWNMFRVFVEDWNALDPFWTADEYPPEAVRASIELNHPGEIKREPWWMKWKLALLRRYHFYMENRTPWEIPRWIYTTNYQLRCLSDPKEHADAYSYDVEVMSKSWFLFGMRIHKRKMTTKEFVDEQLKKRN